MGFFFILIWPLFTISVDITLFLTRVTTSNDISKRFLVILFNSMNDKEIKKCVAPRSNRTPTSELPTCIMHVT